MWSVPAGTRIYMALGAVDMRRGFDGLSLYVQEVLQRDPYAGHLFLFRGKRGDRLKILYADGHGLCLFAKRLDKGRFLWPRLAAENGVVVLTPGQLGYLLEGLDWRAPERVGRPVSVG